MFMYFMCEKNLITITIKSIWIIIPIWQLTALRNVHRWIKGILSIRDKVWIPIQTWLLSLCFVLTTILDCHSWSKFPYPWLVVVLFWSYSIYGNLSLSSLRILPRYSYHHWMNFFNEVINPLSHLWSVVTLIFFTIWQLQRCGRGWDTGQSESGIIIISIV